MLEFYSLSIALLLTTKRTNMNVLSIEKINLGCRQLALCVVENANHALSQLHAIAAAKKSGNDAKIAAVKRSVQ